jgi:hypothetical protein
MRGYGGRGGRYSPVSGLVIAKLARCAVGLAQVSVGGGVSKVWTCNLATGHLSLKRFEHEAEHSAHVSAVAVAYVTGAGVCAQASMSLQKQKEMKRATYCCRRGSRVRGWRRHRGRRWGRGGQRRCASGRACARRHLRSRREGRRRPRRRWTTSSWWWCLECGVGRVCSGGARSVFSRRASSDEYSLYGQEGVCVRGSERGCCKRATRAKNE